MAGNVPFHPAPGSANGGQLPPGFLAVQNTPAAHAAYGVTRSRGISEIIPGAFTVPQNPVKDYVTGQKKPLGQGGCGCGCSGSGGCGGGGSVNGIGVGDLTADWSAINYDITNGNYGAVLSDTVFGVPVWMGLAAIAAVMLLGGSRSYGRGRR